MLLEVVAVFSKRTKDNINIGDKIVTDRGTLVFIYDEGAGRHPYHCVDLSSFEVLDSWDEIPDFEQIQDTYGAMRGFVRKGSDVL